MDICSGHLLYSLQHSFILLLIICDFSPKGLVCFHTSLSSFTPHRSCILLLAHLWLCYYLTTMTHCVVLLYDDDDDDGKATAMAKIRKQFWSWEIGCGSYHVIHLIFSYHLVSYTVQYFLRFLLTPEAGKSEYVVVLIEIFHQCWRCE